ncbi:MAG: AtpZ/AtpI family protein [Spirosoma sp.]|nr:AtpZ/AtpI family protein [Spirosoma sp.]
MATQPDSSTEGSFQKPDQTNPLHNATDKTKSFAEYSGIAFQMLGTIGLGVFAGMKLDEYQQNKQPIWTIILSLTAIGASLYLFIRSLTSK